MKPFYSLLLFLNFAFLSCDQPTNYSDGVTHFLMAEMEARKIPGLQAIVIQEGEVVFEASLGEAEVAFSVPTTEQTLFSINSIGKAFTATTVLQLAEEGKINIDSAVGKYISDLPISWKEITIQSLLSHTSGLPNIEDPEVDQLVGGQVESVAWSLVQEMPLEFTEGVSFSYNATNYLLLQKLIELFSDKEFEAVINGQFSDLGLKQVHFGHSYEIVKGKSPTYSYYIQEIETGEFVEQEQLLVVHETFPLILRGDAGAFYTAKDMAKWYLDLVAPDRILSASSLRRMWTPVQLKDGSYGAYGGPFNAYSLGWPIVRRAEHPAVAAFGGGRASIFNYYEDDLVIILFTNLSGSNPHEIIEGMARIYF